MSTLTSETLELLQFHRQREMLMLQIQFVKKIQKGIISIDSLDEELERLDFPKLCNIGGTTFSYDYLKQLNVPNCLTELEAELSKIEAAYQEHKNMSKEKEEHCIQQMRRFSDLLATTQANPRSERVVQYGYNQGRLMALNDSNNWLNRSMHEQLALEIARIRISTEPTTDPEMMNYGFAIGYLQELSNSNHHIWWKPIAPLIGEEKWSEVSKIVAKNISIFNPHLDWSSMKEEAYAYSNT